MNRALVLLALAGCMYSEVNGDPRGQPRPGVKNTCLLLAWCETKPMGNLYDQITVCSPAVMGIDASDVALADCFEGDLMDQFPESCPDEGGPHCMATCEPSADPCLYYGD
ncbi:MAG: hypothetical protein ABI867_00330 [Kofleriaceae bacterium]